MLKNSPQSANAATSLAPAAPGEISEFLAATRLPSEKWNRASDDAGKIADECRFSPGKTQVPVTELKTNPFRLRTPSSMQPVEDSRRFNREPQDRARTPGHPARGAIAAASIHPARRFAPRCLINNTLYQEGQEVDGFVIEEIALTSVVVHKGVYRFELKMTK